MEEENTDGKRKTTPSIPANYISILQLQERWKIEKDRKQKEEDRRREQQVEEQQRIEEYLKKSEVRRTRRHRVSNSKKKESIDGGEARFAESSAIRSERGEDSTPIDEGLPKKKKKKKKNKGSSRKRYDSRKKTNQDVAVKEEDIVECGGSIAPPENIVTENNTPVKDVIRVYRDKGEKAKGNGPREIAATAIETQFEYLPIKRGEIKAQIRSSNQRHNNTPVKDVIRIYREKGEKAKGNGSREVAVATAMETQFEDLSIKRGGETLKLKAQTRLSNRNRPNHDLQYQRGATMVWVKKGKNERDVDGIGSGVKPLNVVRFG